MSKLYVKSGGAFVPAGGAVSSGGKPLPTGDDFDHSEFATLADLEAQFEGGAPGEVWTQSAGGPKWAAQTGGGAPGPDGQPGPDGAPGADGTLLPFSAAAPITIVEDPVMEHSNGDPIGISADGQQFFQPVIVGAIPVTVGGKKFLIPICEG